MNCNQFDFETFQIGIIGGSGLSNPEILKNGEEKQVDTPYGKVIHPVYFIILTCMLLSLRVDLK